MSGQYGPDQLGLFEDVAPPAGPLPDGTEVRLLFTCPGCGHLWHGASLVIGAWWYTSPEQVAKQPHCPQCQHRPPMPFTCEPPL